MRRWKLRGRTGFIRFALQRKIRCSAWYYQHSASWKRSGLAMMKYNEQTHLWMSHAERCAAFRFSVRSTVGVTLMEKVAASQLWSWRPRQCLGFVSTVSLRNAAALLLFWLCHLQLPSFVFYFTSCEFIVSNFDHRRLKPASTLVYFYFLRQLLSSDRLFVVDIPTYFIQL